MLINHLHPSPGVMLQVTLDSLMLGVTVDSRKQLLVPHFWVFSRWRARDWWPPIPTLPGGFFSTTPAMKNDTSLIDSQTFDPPPRKNCIKKSAKVREQWKVSHFKLFQEGFWWHIPNLRRIEMCNTHSMSWFCVLIRAVYSSFLSFASWVLR